MGLKPTADGIFIGNQQKRIVGLKKDVKSMFKKANKTVGQTRVNVVVIVSHSPDSGLETSGDVGIYSSMGKEKLGEFLQDILKQKDKSYVNHFEPKDYKKIQDVTRSSWLINCTKVEEEDAELRYKRYVTNFFQYVGDEQIEDYWWQDKSVQDVKPTELERLKHRTDVKIVDIPKKTKNTKPRKEKKKSEPSDSVEIVVENKMEQRILYKPTSADFRQFCSDEVYKTSSVYQEHKRKHSGYGEFEPKTAAQRLKQRQFTNSSRNQRSHIPIVVAKKVEEIISEPIPIPTLLPNSPGLGDMVSNIDPNIIPHLNLLEFNEANVPPLLPIKVEDEAIASIQNTVDNFIESIEDIVLFKLKIT